MLQKLAEEHDRREALLPVQLNHQNTFECTALLPILQHNQKFRLLVWCLLGTSTI